MDGKDRWWCKHILTQGLTWAWTPLILLKGWLTEAAAVVVTGLTKGPLFLLAASYALGRVQQTSMMWKHDLTLRARRERRMQLCSYAGRPDWQVWKSKGRRQTHWLLWGKSSRCCIVTKGCVRASAGAILSSASINNIFFSRPTNSRRSAFSASKSLPSRFITKFTCNHTNHFTAQTSCLSKQRNDYNTAHGFQTIGHYE